MRHDAAEHVDAAVVRIVVGIGRFAALPVRLFNPHPLVFVPGIALVFPDMNVADGITAANASPEQLFSYAKSIGIPSDSFVVDATPTIPLS